MDRPEPVAADGALEAPDKKSEAPEAADAMPKGSVVPDADVPEALLDGARDAPRESAPVALLDSASAASLESAPVLDGAPNALLDCEPVAPPDVRASKPPADEAPEAPEASEAPEAPEAPEALPDGTPEAAAEEACEPWCFFDEVEVLDGIGSLARVAV